MGLLWRLIHKKVEEAIKWQVSLEMAKRVRILEAQLDNYRNTIKEAEKLVSKYAKVFKGFQTPNQYINFIMQTNRPLLNDLIRKLIRVLHHESDDIVCYADIIKLEKNEYELSKEAFILCALNFKTKVTGEISIWRGDKVYRVFKGTAIHEWWLPLFTPNRALLFLPDSILYVDAPGDPLVYVIKAEPRGENLHL